MQSQILIKGKSYNGFCCFDLLRERILVKRMADFRCFEQLKQEGHLILLFLKIIFLVFIGVYILTLPAYYFFVVHMMSDALMPLEVMLCFASSFVSFIWVLKMTFQLNREMRGGRSRELPK